MNGYHIVRNISATIVSLLGAIVMVGWFSHTPALIQVLPNFVPMQFNAALGFLISGIGLFCIHRRIVLIPCAIIISVIGLLTLLQYILGLNFGIDQLLMKHYILVETSHPGRMAPNTALCLLLTGVAMLFTQITAKSRETLLMLLSILVLILGFIAFIGYILEVPTIYGWGHLTKMALHTAIGFILIGIGMISYSFNEIEHSKRNFQNLLPLFIFIVGIIIMVLLRQILLGMEHKDISIAMKNSRLQIISRIERELFSQLKMTNRIASYLSLEGDTLSNRKLIGIKMYLSDVGSYKTIVWINKKNDIQLITQHNNTTNNIDKIINKIEQQLQQSDHPKFIKPIKIAPNNFALCAYHSIFVNHQFEGQVISILNMNQLLQDIIPDEIRANWLYSINYQGTTIYKNHTAIDQLIQSNWGEQARIKLGDITLSIDIWPSRNLLTTLYSLQPTIIFVVGIFIFLALAFIIHLWISVKAARLEAIKANKAKSTFLSSMSHELRTPLNAVVGYSQLIEYDEESSSKIKNNARLIVESSKHLLTLINDVLDLAKIEAGKIELSIESVQLNDVMTECFSIIKPMLEKFNIELFYSMQENKKVYIKADYFRLKQILINLISNAIKYNKDKGKITITTKQLDSTTHIIIEDTGKGIPEEKLKQMFTPFQRLGAERSNIEGTGIGLIITRNLAQMMQGEIQIESQVDVGTTTRILLPNGNPKHAKSHKMTESTSLSQLTKNQNQNINILLVEDNPANRSIVIEQMNFLGYRIDVAADGLEGLNSLQSKNYDLILMDCNMPKMDGYELTHRIRTSESSTSSHIPIIAFTANAFKEELQKCFKAGMDDYLVKPVELEILAEKITKWLPNAAPSNLTVTPPNTAHSTASSPIDFTVAEKYLGKDQSIQQKLLLMFVDSTQTTALDLEQAYHQHAATTYQQHAHKLKSSAKAVGALALHTLCASLEAAAKSQDWQKIEATHTEMTQEIQRVIDCIKDKYKN